MPTSNNPARGGPNITPRGLTYSNWAHHSTIDGSKLHAWRKHHGITGRVPLDLVREHIRILHQYGLPYASIARAAGVSVSNVVDIVNDPTRHLIHINIRRAILAVGWTPHPRQVYCLAIGARRRAQALARIGWSLNWQNKTFGYKSNEYMGALRRTVITYDRWDAIRDLYETHSGTPGPSLRAMQDAAKAGHAPPLAWDDDDIDNPTATVTATPTLDVPTIGPQRLQRIARVKQLTALGMTTNAIASRLGVDPRTIGRDRAALREAA